MTSTTQAELTADQLAYLRWIGPDGKCTAHLPGPIADAGKAMAVRRSLIKAGLMTFAGGPGERSRQVLTPAGLAMLSD